MKRNLRIVFMGTPEFAVASLKALVDENYNVVGVITAPDRPAGRGRQLKASAVKMYAKSIGLPILQPTNLKNESFLKALKALQPNLQVVVAFRMLPRIVWQLPEFGTFNLHASLLPEYRGAAPINWAIINGERKTGVTTFFIDEKIDTGEIILNREIGIDPNENVGSLHDKLMVIGSELVIETVNKIQNNSVTPIKQPEHDQLKSAPKLNRDNCKIDWNESVDHIYNKIRGLSPYPAAWSILRNGEDDIQVKFYEVNKAHMKHAYSSGEVIVENEEVKIACENGFIILKEIQLAGRKRMPIKALLNGFNFHSKAKML